MTAQSNTSISPNAVWLSTTEAGDVLGISRQAVGNLIRAGKLEAHQPTGSVYRLRREDVMAYLESTRVQVDVEED